jgi:hypothetical protein
MHQRATPARRRWHATSRDIFTRKDVAVLRIDVNAIVIPGNDHVMGWCDEAWVNHPAVRTRRPEAFDAIMLGHAEASVRPTISALPCEIAELEQRLAAYRRAGAPAVLRLYPGEHGHRYPLEDWAVTPLPELCESEDLCLALDFGPVGAAYPWQDLMRLARTYPRLPVLALGAPLDGPTAARALDAAPNLLLEVSCEIGTGDADALPRLVKTHGAYRLTYGSGRGGHDASAVLAIDPAQAEIILTTTPTQLAGGTWGATHL